VLDSATSFAADKNVIPDTDGDSSSNEDSPSNSYVVVSDDEEMGEGSNLDAPLFLLPVSAAGDHALSARLKDISNYVQSSSNPLPAIAYTLSSRRSHLSHRAFSVVGKNADEMPEFISAQKVFKQSPRLGFVFTGQGAQHAGMGKELYNTMPSFRRDIEAMDQALQSLQSPPKWPLSGKYFQGLIFLLCIP
jgi:acyl transferase domain-containing protein